MNLKATHTLSILLALNFIFLLSACWYILCFIKSNSKIFIITNQKASLEISEKIKNLIESSLYKLRAKNILEQLKTEFPAVKSVEKRLKGNCSKIIKVQLDNPVFMINNDQVLTQQANIISKNFYSPEFYENLNKIYIGDREIDQQESILILKFLENLNAQIFEKYIITWHDKTVITFLDKEDSFFYIKTEFETGFPTKLLEPINKLKEKIKTENLKQRKRKNSIWCADIRFGDKIVLTFKGEGEHEGKKFI